MEMTQSDNIFYGYDCAVTPTFFCINGTNIPSTLPVSLGVCGANGKFFNRRERAIL